MRARKYSLRSCVRRTPWLVALDIVLVAAVAVGVTGFARSDKSIVLNVDGQPREVRTYADDVEGLLEDEDIVVSDRDAVSPSLAAPLHDGESVSVRFARQLRITVDGEPKQIWTTALTVDDALDELGMRAESAVLSASRSERLPLTGFDLGVQLPDQISLLADGKRTTLVTAAPTVAVALREAGIRIGPVDRLDANPQARVRDGMTVKVTRVDVRTKRRSFTIERKTIRRADAAMYEGQSKVVEAGRDGRGVAVYRLTKHDGVVVRRKLVERKVLQRAHERVVRYGIKERPYSPPSTSAGNLNWAALAACESGGNPQAVNPAGYYGLYQFSLGTWAGVGGSGNPIDASPSEQTYRAQLLYQRSGAAPWPVCGSRLYS